MVKVNQISENKSVRFDINGARLLHAGHLSADASWSIPTHWHKHWEFIYFIQGTGRIDIPAGTLRPQAYHLVAYPPELPHSESSSPVDPEETIFFGVDVAGEVPVGAHLVLPDPEGELRWLCERILSECRSHGKTELANTYVRAFLYLVDRFWESGITIKHDVVDLAVQYLRNNYPDDITLQTLAETVSVTESHLVHRFTAKLGISPIRYLQQIRIEAAKRLLITTVLPVNEIARQVGFPDSLYFSKVFKRATGQSPKEYRKRSDP